ncbi:uncharacterized protein LOC103354882 [Stegastes partitus]|uniref:Uncharacterized protein LOC103354882 n=1 Tax=Stegastes partitus TaxID=144197 RepID=A0A9Y4JNH4_9TELE|nr:PREDICTED: uncharacterized protein LOC103354882 [Stegastes partitus]
MTLLRWSILLLCLSVNSETIIKNEGLGQNVTLRCSTTPVNKYKGMYLYHKLAEEEEVFYYQKDNKISPRQRYDGRIQTTGPLADHSITISNLTVEDSGLYTCTYTEGVNKKDGHSVYAVFVAATSSGSTRRKGPRVDDLCPCPSPTAEERSPSLLLIIIACVIAAIIILVTLTVIILILPRVRRCRGSRRRKNNALPGTGDGVYEVMTNKGLYPIGDPE